MPVLAVVVLWFARWKQVPWLSVASVLALFFLGFSSTGLRAVQMAAQQLASPLEGQDIVVTGRITGLPQWNADGARFTLVVDSAELDGHSVALPDRLALGWYLPRFGRGEAAPAMMDESVSAQESDAADEAPRRCKICVYPGERWRMTVRLKQPHGNRNPFGFDYELWLWEQGIGATGYVRSGPKDAPAQRLAGAAWHDWRSAVDAARLRVRESIFRILAWPAATDAAAGVTLAVQPSQPAMAGPDGMQSSQPAQFNKTGSASDPAQEQETAVVPAVEPSSATPTLAPLGPASAAVVSPQRLAGVIAALVMGDQAAIERGDWNIFRITGVAHLMSISGLHITMFAWLAAALVGWFWRRSARWGWPLCLWLPAPQAGLWGGVALSAAYALFSGWGVPAQRTVCMLLVVAVLRHGGRQWPWHATWAVAAAAVLMWDPWALLQAGFWLSFVAVGVLFMTSEQSSVMPVTSGMLQHLWQAVRSFLHEQAVVLLALTPLTLLLFGQVSVIGFVANAVAVPVVTLLVTPLALLGVFWSGLWHAAAWCMQWLMALLTWLSSLPGASYSAAVAPLWVGAVGVAGGVVLSMRHWPWPWRLPGVLALLPVLLWQAPRPDVGAFDVLAADIGQGSGVLVRTAAHSLLFDAGPRFSADSNAGQRVLLPLLGALNEKLDVLVLSHADTDHIGGAEPVLQNQPQVQLLSSITADHPLNRLHEIDRCAAGQHWQWDGVDFDMLHPLEQDYASSQKTNAMSCVLRISNGTHAVLLTGDAEVAQEVAILARHAPESLRADVLLAGHHGSKTSTSNAWLQTVQPQWALIQHGYRNQYHHPHPIVVQRLAARGTITVRSDACGAAWWQSGSNKTSCERLTRQHYWQHVAKEDATQSQ